MFFASRLTAIKASYLAACPTSATTVTAVGRSWRFGTANQASSKELVVVACAGRWTLLQTVGLRSLKTIWQRNFHRLLSVRIAQDVGSG